MQTALLRRLLPTGIILLAALLAACGGQPDVDPIDPHFVGTWCSDDSPDSVAFWLAELLKMESQLKPAEQDDGRRLNGAIRRRLRQLGVDQLEPRVEAKLVACQESLLAGTGVMVIGGNGEGVFRFENGTSVAFAAKSEKDHLLLHLHTMDGMLSEVRPHARGVLLGGRGMPFQVWTRVSEGATR